MNWIGKIFGDSLKGLFEGVDKILSRFKLSDAEKQEFKLQLEELLQKRDSEMEETFRTELRAKERVLVAELQQGDAYTKRARPTVVYAGLAFIFFNYCLVPWIQQLTGMIVQTVDLPAEFWWAWGGICSTWVIGRSAERIGFRNRTTRTITGSRLEG